MSGLTQSWQLWAILAAVFAALTAVFAKLGVASIGSDFATLLRTLVVAVVLGTLLLATGKFQPLSGVPVRSLVFLVLSGLATGASWLCYFRALSLGKAAQVAPVDKLSVVMVAIFAATFLGERLPAAGWLGIALVGIGSIIVAVA